MGSSYDIADSQGESEDFAIKRQHKENGRDCRTVAQQLVSSIPQSVLMKTSYKEKEQEIGTQKKTFTFEEPDKEKIEVESKNPEQKILSGESDVEENSHVNEQEHTDKIFSGEFRWMSRSCTLEEVKKVRR